MSNPEVNHHRASFQDKQKGRVTRSHEDYLEAIVALGGTDEVAVRSVDVAQKMDVSKASVSKAMSALKDAHLLDQPYYGGITLTPSGYEYGKKVLERHTMLYRFLTNELGIAPDVADEEACMLEHDMSDESFEKWIAYIKRIEA